MIVSKIAQCKEISSPHNGQVTVSTGDGVVERLTVRFTCKEGYILQGINSSFATCTDDGLWKPDPSAVTCLGKSYTICKLMSFLYMVLYSVSEHHVEIICLFINFEL